MIIRKAKKEDFEQYLNLQKEFNKFINNLTHPIFHSELSIKNLKKNYLIEINKKTELILLLEENNKIIGFIEGNINKLKNNNWQPKFNKVGYISDVFIKEEYRKKGYFKKCLNELFDFFKKNKVKYCNLHVNIENKSAIKSYEKFGFKTLNFKMWKTIK